MNTATDSKLATPPALPSATLLAAVENACDKWEWIATGTREPLSIALKRKENEMPLFEMVLSMNNLRTQYKKWKAAND